jgi:mannose-6-phosphate isomerase class I
LDKALDIINFPSKKVNQQTKEEKHDGYDKFHYVSNQYFNVNRFVIKTNATINFKTYALVSVLSGEGKILGEIIKKGEHFIIPSTFKDEDIKIEGHLELMITLRTI